MENLLFKEKTCSKCGLLLPITQFYRSNREKDGHQCQCKKCSYAYKMEYRAQNPELIKGQEKATREKKKGRRKEYAKKRRKEMKILVLTHYGDGKLACVKCGESRPACLSIDHINGGGSVERRTLGNKGGFALYSRLSRLNYPEGYQTLCMNCQWVKRDENNENGGVNNKYK